MCRTFAFDGLLNDSFNGKIYLKKPTTFKIPFQLKFYLN